MGVGRRGKPFFGSICATLVMKTGKVLMEMERIERDGAGRRKHFFELIYVVIS